MMLDTSFVVDLLRERSGDTPGPAYSFLRRHRDKKLRMPLFVQCELALGVQRSQNPERERRKLQALSEYIQVVFPAAGFAQVYADIVARLLDEGTPIPVMDALIGTLSLQHGEPLVTRDTTHFRRISGLVVSEYR
jgi:tRNA(fMet)-specific endonuclease VapC